MRIVTWKSLNIGVQAYHIARISDPVGGTPLTTHAHDFVEIMLVESGNGLHLVNAVVQPLTTGDLVFVRAQDHHTVQLPRGSSLTYINLAFPLETLAFLRERYFPEENRFFWEEHNTPACIKLDNEQQRRLGNATRELAIAARTRLTLERYLLNLFYEVAIPPFRIPCPPAWVRELCQRLNDVDLLAAGVPALVDAAQRSPEHVSRALKRWTGKTPTQLVNEARLNLAAARLCMSDDPILQIALEIGFANLSHFYACFHKQFALTPRQYRQRHTTAF